MISLRHFRVQALTRIHRTLGELRSTIQNAFDAWLKKSDSE
jgi:hypothetical protein